MNWIEKLNHPAQQAECSYHTNSHINYDDALPLVPYVILCKLAKISYNCFSSPVCQNINHAHISINAVPASSGISVQSFILAMSVVRGTRD